MSNSPPRCLLVEGCDFDRFPAGGQLSFAKLMMAAFGPRLALVGTATDSATPVGRWIKKRFGADEFDFFAADRRTSSSARPLVPARLSRHIGLRIHRRGILSLGVRSAFAQAPEDLLALSRWGLPNICYRFPGVDNPLEMARYSWAKRFASAFDRQLFAALGTTGTILACADERSVSSLIARSGGALCRDRVRRITTYYDSRVFFPTNRDDARTNVGLTCSQDAVVVASGRLNRVKGWDLILRAFALLCARRPRSKLVFVGDGEDRSSLEKAVRSMSLTDNVRITGFVPPHTVSQWLNAADVAVVGSHREGWSLAMLEALACGLPMVSTDVSGARSLIRQGSNGFVVDDRSPEPFADALERVLRLPGAREVSLDIARQYDISSLGRNLAALWPVLA